MESSLFRLEYVIDVFELPIFRYVPKKDMERRLPLVILDAVKLIDSKSDLWHHPGKYVVPGIMMLLAGVEGVLLC